MINVSVLYTDESPHCAPEMSATLRLRYSSGVGRFLISKGWGRIASVIVECMLLGRDVEEDDVVVEEERLGGTRRPRRNKYRIDGCWWAPDGCLGS